MSKPAKVLVLYYSMYGHVFKLAQAAVEGARSTGAEVVLKRVPETLPKNILELLHAVEPAKEWANIPIVTSQELSDYDGFIVGSPTRFGNMPAQMKTYIDTLGHIWVKNLVVGKPVSLFTSTGSQHGGIDATLLTSMIPWMHLGCVIVGLPYTFQGQTTLDEINGCSPYGAGTNAGGRNERYPSKLELDGARFQGKHLAQIAAKLARQP